MWSSVVFLHLLILFTCSHCLFPPSADTLMLKLLFSKILVLNVGIHGVYFQLQTLSAKAPCSNWANNTDLWHTAVVSKLMCLLETSQEVFCPLHLIRPAWVGFQVGTGGIGSHWNGDSGSCKQDCSGSLWGAAGDWNASVSQTDLEMWLKWRNETVLSFTGMKIVSSRHLMYFSTAL